MMKYKNIKTYERLKEIQPQSPVIELSTKEEIQQRFTIFSEEYRNKVFPDGLHKANKPIEQQSKKKQSQTSIYAQNANQRPKTSVSLSNIDHTDHLQGFIDDKFKSQLQRNMTKENPIVKMFGNALIGTVFQSLVIKTIEQLFKISINIETNLPISTNVLKAFNISTVAINSFKTNKQKAEYILSCMDKSIQEMYSAFEDKQSMKDKKLEEQDKIEEKKKVWKSQDEHFPWLKIKTSYESLRQKLNTVVIEKLNDYENLIGVLECLKVRQELKNEGKDSKAGNERYVLQNIKMTSTKDVFQNMSKYGNPRIQQFLSRLGLSDQTEQLSTSTFFKSEDKKKNEKKENQDNEESKQDSNEVPNPLEFDNLWSKEKEQQFLENKQNKKKLYYNEVNSSSWNEVGFLPFVQKYFIELKKQMQRDHLLDKYGEGEWLTAEELKLLANTSELLNSCIDKKFMQSAVDAIDKEVIENLELTLAEGILKDYEEIQIQVKKNRNDFIKESLEKTQLKLQEFEQKRQKEHQRESNSQYHSRKKKLITSICCKMENEGKLDESAPKNLEGASALKSFVQGKIDKEELIKDLRNVTQYNDQYEEQIAIKNKQIEQAKKKEKTEKWNKYIGSISQPKQTSNSKFYKSVTRHQYHPPSKLFVLGETQAQEEGTPEEQMRHLEMEKKLKESNKNDQENFKLNLKAHIAYKNPHNFRKYYTGGPTKPTREDPFFNPNLNDGLVVTDQELKYIIMIQKRYRQHMQMKKMRLMLDNKQKEKHYEYKQKIDQIRQVSKQQFRLELGESQSVKDLQIIVGDERSSQYNNQRQSQQLYQQYQSQQQQQKGQNHHTSSKSQSAKNVKAKLNSTLKSQNYFVKNHNQSQNEHQSVISTTISNSLYFDKLNQSITNKTVNNSLNLNNSKFIDNRVNFPTSPIVQKRSRPSTAISYNRQSDIFQDYSMNKKPTHHQQSTDTSLLSNQLLVKQKDHAKHGSGQKMSNSFSSVPVWTPSEHYTDLAHYDTSNDTNLKIKQLQLATTPIEKQLRNVKLIYAARQNQFWAINTNQFVFSKRDLCLARDNKGWTALHWATFNKNTEFIQWLLNKGADTNIPDSSGNTPTHTAFSTNKKEVIVLILNGGGNLNHINQKGETPLAKGSEQTLKQLNLDNGVKGIDSSQNHFDNNNLLKFITREEMSSFQEEAYSFRFESKKFTKEPTDRLNKSQSKGHSINQIM